MLTFTEQFSKQTCDKILNKLGSLIPFSSKSHIFFLDEPAQQCYYYMVLYFIKLSIGHIRGYFYIAVFKTEHIKVIFEEGLPV